METTIEGYRVYVGFLKTRQTSSEVPKKGYSNWESIVGSHFLICSVYGVGAVLYLG